jgi:hypothetical protein
LIRQIKAIRKGKGKNLDNETLNVFEKTTRRIRAVHFGRELEHGARQLGWRYL